MRKKYKIILTILVASIIISITLSMTSQSDPPLSHPPLKIYGFKDIPNLDVHNPCSGTGVVFESIDRDNISIVQKLDEGWMLLYLESKEGFQGLGKVREGNVVYFRAEGPVQESYPGTVLNVYQLDVLGDVEQDMFKEIKKYIFHQMHEQE